MRIGNLNKRDIFTALACVVAAFVLYSCASIGNPSGGPRDEDPPRFVRANPAPGSLNVDKSKVVIEFDELVNVKDAFNKVVVSPSSEQPPKVSSSGRKVTVDFGDSLQKNTTYTIDFGDAIEDNNEGNKLTSFSYWFSTGPEIDSLRISGMVLAARDLEPQQGMLVGVHSNPSDSAFKTIRLERVAKTDDRGRFTIRGLKPGKYRVYALKDLNNDFRWDNPEEEMAFYDTFVSPSFETVTALDTIWNLKDAKVDTVVERSRTRFLPNDILLNSFNLGYKSQYLVKYERPDSLRLTLQFNTKADTLPEISLVGKPDLRDWYTLERSASNDTLIYWFRDKDLIRSDTLMVALKYLRTDSATVLKQVSDTLRMLKPVVRTKKNDKKKEKTDTLADTQIKLLELKNSASGSYDVYKPAIFTSTTPIDTIFTDLFTLEVKNDTVWTRVPVPLSFSPPDSLSHRSFALDFPWEYGKQYRLTADSMAVHDIYGVYNGKLKNEFTIKKQEDYSALSLTIRGLAPDMHAFVELLGTSDKPVRIATVENGRAVFKHLAPGQYYARLVADANGNGIYDSGNFDEGLQPEIVYYLPKKINLKANWDLDQEWDINAVPVDTQKPLAIKKNKSEEEKKRKTSNSGDEDEQSEQEPFDPTANPFAPKPKNKSMRATNLRM